MSPSKMQYLISAVLMTVKTFIQPQKSLTPTPVPKGAVLPMLGPVAEEPKPKRKRRSAAEAAANPKPRAQKNKNEKEIRAILERLTGLKWPSCRPSFLLADKNRPLELDMYCPQMNIAVEHQGQQHLGYVKFFHPNGPSDFEEQKRRDAIKRELCKRNGVKLVCILCTEWDKLGADPKVKDDFILGKIGSVV